MQVKEIQENKAVIELDLYEIRCPYCDALLKPTDRKKTCKCKIVKYKLVKEPKDEPNVKTYPVLNKKKVEIDCLTTDSFIEFEIPFKQKTVTILYDKKIKPKPTSDKLREMLSLPFEEIIEVMSLPIELKKEKKTLLYVGNLTFEQRINFLKLKKMRILETAFNKYLLKED